MSNIEEFNKILNDLVAKLPDDKQAHYHLSKALFLTIENDLKSQSTMLLYVLFRIYFIGFIKELRDKNISEYNVLEDFDKIKEAIINIDKFIVSTKLDTGDLDADLLGALSAVLLNHIVFHDIQVKDAYENR